MGRDEGGHALIALITKPPSWILLRVSSLRASMARRLIWRSSRIGRAPIGLPVLFPATLKSRDQGLELPG